MGAWDSKPWDNDSGADWFGNLFDQTQLRTKVRAVLEAGLGEGRDDVRAAAALLLFLGRTYVWPVDHLDSDLELAIDRLKELKASYSDEEGEFLLADVNQELSLLKARRYRDQPMPDDESARRWWLGLR